MSTRPSACTGAAAALASTRTRLACTTALQFGNHRKCGMAAARTPESSPLESIAMLHGAGLWKINVVCALAAQGRCSPSTRELGRGATVIVRAVLHTKEMLPKLAKNSAPSCAKIVIK